MRKILVIGGAGPLPEGLIQRLRAQSLEVVSEEQLQAFEDEQGLDLADLVSFKIRRAEPARMPRARTGKGEKRRNKKLRGW